MATFRGARDPYLERSGVDRAQQCRAAAAGEKSFGDGREIGAAEAGFLSGSSAGGNPARIAAGDGSYGVADAVWTAQRVEQGIRRAGGDGGDGGNRTTGFREHPDEQSGVSPTKEQRRAWAWRYRGKK